MLGAVQAWDKGAGSKPYSFKHNVFTCLRVCFVLFCSANWFGETVEGHKDGGICCPHVKPDLAFPGRAWGIGSALHLVLGRTGFLVCFMVC